MRASPGFPLRRSIDLTPDYTDVTGYYTTHFPRVSPPDVREATAHFYRKGKHYLVTSGTTGYLPNPTEVAVADTWHGPYTVQGHIHTGDETHTSFHSQISCIFKVEGKKDLYIACADRWLPELQHLEYNVYSELFRNAFDPERRSEDTVREMQAYLGDDSHRNTAISDYVWLPLRFEGERVFIDWKEEWRLEDY